MQWWIWSHGTYYIHSQGWRPLLGPASQGFGSAGVVLGGTPKAYANVNLHVFAYKPHVPHTCEGHLSPLLTMPLSPTYQSFVLYPPSHPYLIITLYDTKTRLVCTLKTTHLPTFVILTRSLSMYGWRVSIHANIFLTN